MAIEDILRTLEEQAQADCDAVIDEAKAHAAQILEDARQQAEDIRDGHARQVERSARTAAGKVVNAARLQAKMEVSSVKGDGLDSVFATARERLGTLAEGAGYPELFARLAAEALDGTDGALVVRVRAKDAALAKAAIAAAGVSASVVQDLDATGGLVVEAHEGRIIRRNTLEDRLERARQYVQADVAKALLS